MTTHHELDRVVIQDGDLEVGNITPEEAIELANGLLDAASKSLAEN